MSTRYVWDKSSIEYVKKAEITDDFEHSTSFIPSGGVYAYFSTGISFDSSGGYTLTGSIKEATRSQGGAATGFFADATVYKYAASRKSGTSFYVEHVDDYSPAFWYAKLDNDGRTFGIRLRSDTEYTGKQFRFNAYTYTQTKGEKIGTVSSAQSEAYPKDGRQAGFWYSYKSSDSIDPLSVAYSTDMLERGEAVTVMVEPANNVLGGTTSYLYQYSVDGGRTWASTGDITTETQLDIIVPKSAEQFMARVRAQDDIGFTSADYVTGANLEVQTMRLWVGVDGAARRGRKLWVGVDGAARPVTRAWVGDENGKARRWF